MKFKNIKNFLKKINILEYIFLMHLVYLVIIFIDIFWFTDLYHNNVLTLIVFILSLILSQNNYILILSCEFHILLWHSKKFIILLYELLSLEAYFYENRIWFPTLMVFFYSIYLVLPSKLFLLLVYVLLTYPKYRVCFLNSSILGDEPENGDDAYNILLSTLSDNAFDKLHKKLSLCKKDISKASYITKINPFLLNGGQRRCYPYHNLLSQLPKLIKMAKDPKTWGFICIGTSTIMAYDFTKAVQIATITGDKAIEVARVTATITGDKAIEVARVTATINGETALKMQQAEFQNILNKAAEEVRSVDSNVNKNWET